jgi:hypothetical protein
MRRQTALMWAIAEHHTGVALARERRPSTRRLPRAPRKWSVCCSRSGRVPT